MVNKLSHYSHRHGCMVPIPSWLVNVASVLWSPLRSWRLDAHDVRREERPCGGREERRADELDRARSIDRARNGTRKWSIVIDYGGIIGEI